MSGTWQVLSRLIYVANRATPYQGMNQEATFEEGIREGEGPWIWAVGYLTVAMTEPRFSSPSGLLPT